MTAYRRLRLPGATYIFTLCLQRRGSALLTEHVALLRHAWGTTLRELPVAAQAVVILPDHLHAIWREPEGRVDYSERWRRIKARFSRALPDDAVPRQDLRPSLRIKRERGIWQRRFWEHAIRDEAELAMALAYLRANPVRHRLVRDPADWPYSSFNRAQDGRAQDGRAQDRQTRPAAGNAAGSPGRVASPARRGATRGVCTGA